MKYSYKLILSFSFLFIAEFLCAQPAIEWAKSFGGRKSEVGELIIQTIDNGYIIAGYSNSNDGDIEGDNHGDYDCWIVKLDEDGDKIWAKSFGGTGKDYCAHIAQTTDSGYVVLGSSDSNDGDIAGDNHGGFDYWILKLDENGNKTWAKSFGGTGQDSGSSIIQTADNGYIISGLSMSNDGDIAGDNHGGFDCWILKLDEDGNKTWAKSFGGTALDYGRHIVQTSDNGYLVSVFSKSNDGDVAGDNHGNTDYLVIKLDKDGNKIWAKSFGGTESEDPVSTVQTSDNGYLVSGWSSSNNGDVEGDNHGSSDYWVVKLDEDGNKIWAKSFGGTSSEINYSTISTFDDGLMLAGGSYSNDGDVEGHNRGLSDCWLLKLDKDGNKIWSKLLGGTRFDRGQSIIQESNNSYVMLNYSTSYDGDILRDNHGASDYWVVKTAPEQTIDSVKYQVIQKYQSNYQGFTEDLNTYYSNTGTWTGNSYFAVCSDGSEVSKFIVKGLEGTNVSNWELRIQEQTASNVSKFGYFNLLDNSNDELQIKYTHPSFIDNDFSPYSNYTLEIFDTEENATIETLTLRVYRAPVLMIHGFWRDKNAFEVMKKDFLNKGIYTNYLLKNVDYSESHGLAFDANALILYNAISDLKTSNMNLNIAVGKVDVVGHSTGGILGRYYLQQNYYRNDINRLITINTPHSGAQGINLLKDKNSWFYTPTVCSIIKFNSDNRFLSSNKSCLDGVARDLQVNSTAMNSLNNINLNKNVVPSHAIVTTSNFTNYANVLEVEIGNSTLQPMPNTKIGFLLTLPAEVIENLDSLFNGETHDLIASYSSQSGGLEENNVTIVDSCTHMTASANHIIISKVEHLLKEKPTSNKFAQNGYSPIPQTYELPLINTESRNLSNNGFTDINIDISTPISGQSFDVGDEVSIMASGTSGITNIVAVMQIDNNEILRGEKKMNIADFSFTANHKMIGERTIFIYGYDMNNNTFVFDSVNINVSSTTLPDSLTTIPEDNLTLTIYEEKPIKAIAHFGNAEIDVSYLPEVQYQLGKQNILKRQNILRGISEGTNKIIVTYMGIKDSINVNITGYLACTLPSVPLEFTEILSSSVYPSASILTSSVTIKSETDLTFIAGKEIKLTDGFNTEPGAAFLAKIHPCTPDTVLGCMTETAHNFNSFATKDDGSCQTCDDNVQNGDETGIDCGGNLCPECLDELHNKPRNINNSEKMFESAEVMIKDVSPIYKETASIYLSIIPNPITNQSLLTFNIPHDQKIIIKLHDSVGQELKIITDALYLEGQYQLIIDNDALMNGIYYISLHSKSEIVTKKISVIK